jgi:hypothetical protein
MEILRHVTSLCSVRKVESSPSLCFLFARPACGKRSGLTILRSCFGWETIVNGCGGGVGIVISPWSISGHRTGLELSQGCAKRFGILYSHEGAPWSRRMIGTVLTRDSSVDIARGYWLDGRGLIPGRGKMFFLLHSVQTGSGAYPASCPMGTGGWSGLLHASGMEWWWAAENGINSIADLLQCHCVHRESHVKSPETAREATR